MFMKRKTKKATDPHFLDKQRIDKMIRPDSHPAEVAYLRKMSASAESRIDWRNVPEHLKPKSEVPAKFEAED